MSALGHKRTSRPEPRNLSASPPKAEIGGQSGERAGLAISLPSPTLRECCHRGLATLSIAVRGRPIPLVVLISRTQPERNYPSVVNVAWMYQRCRLASGAVVNWNWRHASTPSAAAPLRIFSSVRSASGTRRITAMRTGNCDSGRPPQLAASFIWPTPMPAIIACDFKAARGSGAGCAGRSNLRSLARQAFRCSAAGTPGNPPLNRPH
jgi:hypothetical protein